MQEEEVGGNRWKGFSFLKLSALSDGLTETLFLLKEGI